MVCSLISCNKANKIGKNKEFEAALGNYFKYVDSVGFKHNFDYIFIEATKNRDSTVFVIYLYGGAYYFLHYTERIIDFTDYKKYEIVLIGDYPNDVVNVGRNKKLNIVNDILKVRYPKDYNKFLKDNHSVAPLIYDYMDMTLIFKQDKLISCKRQFY
jgi:hypothetical protein